MKFDEDIADINLKPAVSKSTFTERDARKTTFGEIVVSVPSRKARRISQPLAFNAFGVRIGFPYDPKKHFILYDYNKFSEGAFRTTIGSKTCASGQKSCAFIFVHGFNTTMKFAAFRAAQIKAQSGFDGHAMIYSWPTEYMGAWEAVTGNQEPYKNSQRIADRTAAKFLDFLELVQSEVDEVHIIAHSMGNRVILKALEQKGGDRPTPLIEKPLEQLIMAAPDVDRSDFLSAINALMNKSRAKGVTLYASSKDRAMQVSRKVNNPGRDCDGDRDNYVEVCSPRAGDVPPNQAQAAIGPNHYTIDVTLLTEYFFDTNLINHGYEGESELVKDMSGLLNYGELDPERRRNRSGVNRIDVGDGAVHLYEYW